MGSEKSICSRRSSVAFDNTMPDLPVPENPALTLKVGTTGLVEPFSYYEGNQLTGRYQSDHQSSGQTQIRQGLL